METRASHIVVGLFVLALVAATVMGVLWLAGTDLERRHAPYLAYFMTDVTGLSVGGAVRYRGVTVGSVSAIRIDPDNIERIEVIMEIAETTPVREDTYATLGWQGITGIAFVQLAGGSQASPPLTARADAPYPVIETRPSGLETVMQSAPELLENAVLLSERLEMLLSPANLSAFTETMESVRALSTTLAGRGDDLSALLQDGAAAAQSFRRAAADLEALAGQLRREAAPLVADTRATMTAAEQAVTDVQVTLADVQSAAGALGRFAARLDEVVAESQPGLRDFSATGLYEFSLFIAEARQLVSDVNRLVAEIQRDPSRFFFGDAQRGFEAQ